MGSVDLDLTADVVTVAERLVDIESVSRDEQRIADAVEAALAPCAHLTVTRHGHTVVARTAAHVWGGECRRSSAALRWVSSRKRKRSRSRWPNSARQWSARWRRITASSSGCAPSSSEPASTRSS